MSKVKYPAAGDGMLSEAKHKALARVYQFILSLPDPRIINNEPESEDLSRAEDSGSIETLSFNLEDEGCEP